MNNTDKLLRAFIEAQGYEVERVVTHNKCNPIGDGDTTPYPLSVNVDYKVTKNDTNKNNNNSRELLPRVMKESGDGCYIFSCELADEIKELLDDDKKPIEKINPKTLLENMLEDYMLNNMKWEHLSKEKKIDALSELLCDLTGGKNA